MKNNKNDPRLTAYLLNELSSEDRKQFELELAQDKALQIELQLMQKSLEEIKKFNLTDSNLKLSTKRKEDLFQKIKSSKKNRFALPLGLTSGGLLVASLALIVFNHSLKNEVGHPLNTEVYEADQLTAVTAAPMKKEKVKNIEMHAAPEGSQRLAKEEKAAPQPSQGFLGGGGASRAAAPTAQRDSAPERESFNADVAADFAAAEEAPVVAQKSAVMAEFKKKSVADSKIEIKNRELKILEVTPKLNPDFKDQVFLDLKNCLQSQLSSLSKSFDFEIIWAPTTQQVSYRSPYQMSPEVTKCIEHDLSQRTWPQSNTFVFKVKFVSN